MHRHSLRQKAGRMMVRGWLSWTANKHVTPVLVSVTFKAWSASPIPHLNSSPVMVVETTSVVRLPELGEKAVYELATSSNRCAYTATKVAVCDKCDLSSE